LIFEQCLLILNPKQTNFIKEKKPMDMTTVNPVRDTLLKESQQFRDLAQIHENYEKRLTELANLTYPNDEELLEESTLKKKKLVVKDELYAMMNEYSKKGSLNH
jgi:uncharacterized protein YdcH (DUF465 family)